MDFCQFDNVRQLKICTFPCDSSIAHYAQTLDPQDLLEGPFILNLSCIKVREGQKVKIDSFVEIQATTISAWHEDVNIVYELQRNGVTILPMHVIDSSSLNYNFSKTYHPNITWVDSPMSGIYIYSIKVSLQ